MQRKTLITLVVHFTVAGLVLCDNVEYTGQRETYESLLTPPRGAVELIRGNFFSSLLDREIPYRVFSPEQPVWEMDLKRPNQSNMPESMPLAIYVLNIKTPAPRPSSASDRDIIEDLIKRQFLVVTVDYEGAEIRDHEEWSRDINGLGHVFGAKSYLDSIWYSENRKQFLNLPGPHAGREVTSFIFNGEIKIPIHMNRIYVLPPGYTVDYYHVINEGFGVSPSQDDLFMDIVYPMPGEHTRPLPVVLAQSATGRGDHVMNSATFFLYSWLFNGYALAVSCNVKYKDVPADMGKYPIVHAIRYLRWKKKDFSLNGIVSTTGISKSSKRVFMESHLRDEETSVDNEPYGKERSQVSVVMPAVGGKLLLDGGHFSNDPILKNLAEDSPAVVLTWNHLNKKGTDDGSFEAPAKNAYIAKGLEHKLFYKEVPQGAHEYDLYDLNEIMAFWDRFCK